jgi:hypothetical protein
MKTEQHSAVGNKRLKPLAAASAIMLSTIALAGCSNQEVSNAPKIAGKVSAKECDKPVHVVSGTYPKSEIKKIQAKDAAIQKEVCVGAYVLAQKILEVYQSQETKPDEAVTAHVYKSSFYEIQVIRNDNQVNERGATLNFGLTEAGEIDLANLETVDIWARSETSQQAVSFDLYEPKMGWGMQNWSAATEAPIAGLPLLFFDSKSSDLLGWRKNPSMQTLVQQEKVLKANLGTLTKLVDQQLSKPAN